MHDPRNKKLADIFLDYSLKIKPKDNLVIMVSDLQAIDLIRECYKGALQRGAIVYLDVLGLSFLRDISTSGDLVKIFYEHANEFQLVNHPSIHKAIVNWGNKFLNIVSMDNTQYLNEVDGRKIQIKKKATQKISEIMIKKKWVLTYFPTQAFAQEAGMGLYDMVDFYYKSVLVDYKKMEKQMLRLAKIIDHGKSVHIKGHKTDINFGIEGRTAMPCCGECNIPDGEVFTGPEETKTEGYIYYDFPTMYDSKKIHGIYLEFKKGKVINFSAEIGQQHLEYVLDTDPGARRLGELAIGTNYGIKRFVFETLFDEKIGGTIHTALGKSYTDSKGWGKNKSAIHWDLIKDTRIKGGQVWVDNKLILKDGKILV